VYPAGNTYKVRFIADVPKSLVNQYIKKETEAGNDKVKSFFSESDIAEAIVRFSIENSLTLEKLPIGIMTGEVAAQETQLVQPVQVQPAQDDMNTEPQVQVQTQIQGEQPAQVQGQAQPQTQAQPQAQVQSQVQVQTETEVSDLDEEDNEEDNEEDVDLPL
jgi:hypothetical protein